MRQPGTVSSPPQNAVRILSRRQPSQTEELVQKKYATFSTSHPFRQLHQRACYTFGEVVADSAEYLFSKLCRTHLEKPSHTAASHLECSHSFRERTEIGRRGKEIYHLDIVGVFSTMTRGSGTVDLDGGWKLFYLGANPSMSA